MSDWTCETRDATGERCVLARGHEGTHATVAQYLAGQQLAATSRIAAGGGGTSGVRLGIGFALGCAVGLVILAFAVPLALGLLAAAF